MAANRLGTRKEGFQELDPALEKIGKRQGYLTLGYTISQPLSRIFL